MKNKCLVIGDLNIDLIFSKLDRFPEIGSEIIAEKSFLDIGGSGGIFSAVLSQLGSETIIISEIGNDHLGRFLIERLGKFGVKTDLIEVHDNKNTGISVTASYAEDKYQISELTAVNTMNFVNIKGDIIEDINHVHFTSYYMMKNLIPKYTEIIKEIKRINNSITFSLDTNDDPEDNWKGDLSGVLKNIDILFVNKKESLKISGSKNIEEAIKILKNMVANVVVKLGPEGSLAHFSGDLIKTKALTVDFQDSTGAGDNFDAGFIHGYLKGYDEESALKIANICGGESVRFLGGVGKIERFLQLKKNIDSVI